MLFLSSCAPSHTVLGMRTVVYEGWKKVGYIPNTGNFEYICECLVVLAILLMIEYTMTEIIIQDFHSLFANGRGAGCHLEGGRRHTAGQGDPPAGARRDLRRADGESRSGGGRYQYPEDDGCF